MASFFALGDALLVHLKDERTFEMTVPAKTHSYMACGKPIIMGVKGEAARLINSSGCGIVCPPENPQALADTVIQLKHMNASERERMGQAGLGLFESRFTKSVLLSKLENLIFDTASIPIG
jgi:glycosyltransferase involved in cell wall biosynthesis